MHNACADTTALQGVWALSECVFIHVRVCGVLGIVCPAYRLHSTSESEHSKASMRTTSSLIAIEWWARWAHRFRRQLATSECTTPSPAYAPTHTHTHTHTLIHTHTCTHTHTHCLPALHMYIHTQPHTRTHTQPHTCTHTQPHTRTQPHTHTRTHSLIRIHTHKHTPYLHTAFKRAHGSTPYHTCILCMHTRM